MAGFLVSRMRRVGVQAARASRRAVQRSLRNRRSVRRGAWPAPPAGRGLFNCRAMPSSPKVVPEAGAHEDHLGVDIRPGYPKASTPT